MAMAIVFGWGRGWGFKVRKLRGGLLVALMLGAGLNMNIARADQVDRDFQLARQQLDISPSLSLSPSPPSSFLQRTSSNLNEVTDRALELLGVRYRRGGNSPERGFDCSGFVDHVFKSIGTLLPRTSHEMSRRGEAVEKDELQPGDLVFFNTMRRTFSHVGIYLGNHRFVHAPASGGKVRVDDMREKYWGRRYNGARRVQAD